MTAPIHHPHHPHHPNNPGLPLPSPGRRRPARAATRTLFATMGLAVLAALTQTACLGDDAGLMAAVDPAAPWSAVTGAASPAGTDAGLRPAAQPGACDALRHSDALQARLALDYQADRPLPAGGRLQQRHAADVQATLRLLQRDADGAVWSGAVDQGALRLDDRLQPARHGARSSTSARRTVVTPRQLSGQGEPGTGPALTGSALTVRVVFADCSLHYAARLAVAATERTGGGRMRGHVLQPLGRLTLAENGGALHLRNGALPVLSGAREVRVDARLQDSGYQPAGLAAQILAPVPAQAHAQAQEAPGAAQARRDPAAGTARLRWQFTPVPAVAAAASSARA